MSRSILPAAALAAAALLAVAAPADAQILRKIGDRTKAKVAEKVTKTEERVLNASGEVVDSVAEKSARGADSVVSKTGNALAGAVDRTERAVASVFRRGGSESELATALAGGHVVLDDLRFESDGSLSGESHGTLRALARHLRKSADVWMIEGHVAAGADDVSLSEGRAKAVKGALLDAGVEPPRVWARGLGASRPPAAAGAPVERSERVRMQ